MSEQWLYQLRIDVADEHAKTLRSRREDPALVPLLTILRRHGAEATCQYDAFAGYCAEAEREGVADYPLYDWTKATIENPVKKAKYLKSFTLYVDGDQVYPKDKAEALEDELLPLIGADVVTKAYKYDTNPANNPQPPARRPK